MLVSCTQDRTRDAGGRPNVYSAKWTQFDVDGLREPRLMTILRSGAGPVRRAEFYVFELVGRGRRVAVLHKHKLRNEYVPWAWQSLGNGRFLVTKGDRPGGGLTENCFVVYDFVRSAAVARRLEDFIPFEMRHKGKGVDVGMGWFSGPGTFDAERLLYYPNDVDDCQTRGCPFLTVDLPSLTVAVSSIPDRLGYSVRVWTVEWRWSMGNAADPAWDAPSRLPTYLLAVVDERHPRMADLVGLGLTDGEPSQMKTSEPRRPTFVGWRTCFKLDGATGDYMRCPVSEWVERSEEPVRR